MASYLRLAIITACLALTAPFVYDRYLALSLFVTNSPGKIRNYERWPTDVKFRDEVRNCEDVLLVEDRGFAMLSCDAGREGWNAVMGVSIANKSHGGLYLYNYGSSDLPGHDTLQQIELSGYPDADEFHPLGIEYHASSSMLIVANHHSAGNRLEIFTLELPSATPSPEGSGSSQSHPVAIWQRTFMHPLLRVPNSIAALGPDSVVVTTSLRFPRTLSPYWLFKAEIMSGAPLGEVLFINLRTDTVVPLARVPFANGVTLFGTRSLAVASSNKPGVYVYDVSYTVRHEKARGLVPVLTKREFIRTPFHVDNLSVDKEGSLVMAGHPHSPSLDKVAHDVWRCRRGDGDKEGCDSLSAPSWVRVWKEGGNVTDVFVDDGGKFGCSAGAVRDFERGVGIAVGLYEKGVLVWRE